MEKLAPPDLPEEIARQLPPGVTRYRVDVGGVAMHVQELGQGRPVLLVHGNPTWGFLWRKVMTALSGASLRLVAPDLIGLGLSDKPIENVGVLERQGAWLGSLVEQLDLRDLVLVVQDWGGAVGLLAMHPQRDRLAGLVLLNTAVTPPRPGFRSTAFHRLSQAPVISDVLFRLGGFPLRHLHRSQGDPSSISGEVARAYRWPLRRLRDNAAPLQLARMVPDSLDHPSVPALVRCQEVLTGFSGPTEIVWGVRDPILGRVVNHLERLLPAAKVTRTEAGHFLQEEVPDVIAEAIRRVAT